MDKISRKFIQYHNDNPHIYALFVKYAKQAHNAGYMHYSANAIFERIRWHVDVETRGDQFKMNNNYRALYARMAMKDYPELRDFFRTRVRVAV